MEEGFERECLEAWRAVAHSTCSRKILGEAVQPCYVVGDVKVCEACTAVALPENLAEPSSSPFLSSFRCGIETLAAASLAFDVFGEAADERQEGPKRVALLEGALDDAVERQRSSRPAESLASILASGRSVWSGYSPSAIQAARNLLPFAADSGRYPDDSLALRLLDWFKGGFFKWFSKPNCASCGNSMELVRTEGPVSDYERKGLASRVEVYECSSCSPDLSPQSRFPRLNDPVALLQSRVGRCGEFANYFTLFCLAAGFRARYVLDVTDHVWTEIWSESQQRWLHADSCEKKLDKPRLYEYGWGKKLIAVFAFGEHETVDVTKRYARKDYAAVLERRALRWGCSEKAIREAVRAADKASVKNIASPPQILRDTELREMAVNVFGGPEDEDDKAADGLGGRTTGEREWIEARGEGGSSSPLPGGSWRNSARNPSLSEDKTVLSAELRTSDGSWREASALIVLDDDEFENIDGEFRRSAPIRRRALHARASKLREEAVALGDASLAAEIRRRHRKIIANVLSDPTNEKFRLLNLDNAVVGRAVVATPSASLWLNLAVGFEETSGENKLKAPRLAEDDEDGLRDALEALDTAWPI